MTKKEVIKELGSPKATIAQDNMEVLEYKFLTSTWGYFETYWVRFKNGSVDKFGDQWSFPSYDKSPKEQNIIQIQNNTVLNEPLPYP